MLPIQLFPLFSAIGCLARPLIPFGEIHSPFTPTLRRVSQFPLGTWVENIAVRPNGHLLITLTSAPEIYEIDPFSVTSANDTRPAFSFDGYSNVTGLTEIETDIFVTCVDGRYVWKLDFSMGNTPQASLVTMIPDAQLLNGVATLNSAKGIVVIADSSGGCIWRVDINTGEYEVILKDGTMHPEPILGLNLGINGLKVLGNTIYYTNTPKQLFCRVQVDPISARATGPIDVISDTIEADDFAITSSGVAYLATIYQNAITKVPPAGRSEIVTASLNSSSIRNPTSAAFGRTMVDANVLYISSGGGPINGSFVEGGAVVSIEIW
ncbi:putative L-ascorbate peroxidase 6 [Aspergillus lentulus]|uniref:L-ascorbate peroxidase 6 n=1 Tax=Aspergillus lentulus TaxID=293939 RepID=A0ABQ1AY71_ASPLE|nr:putative L-ascorbate peroxidase 6 [Aspergillus lentulus]GFF24211.1 putative L-ascorbate peroxidase 6 [Aspergillus lentulus]GFF55274.1 putative L-ascorbate peroxidase 6 [Aspergillus lentulus]GFF90211.1 putative L-ascorbate peroxidase 6 [Aspergillus lentulus]